MVMFNIKKIERDEGKLVWFSNSRPKNHKKQLLLFFAKRGLDNFVEVWNHDHPEADPNKHYAYKTERV